MIEGLSDAQLEAILHTLPMNFIFVDDNERLIYRNKATARGESGAPDIMGKDIRGCHKESSLPRLEQMVSDFKSGAKDEDEFWMMVPERKILNRFLAVRDRSGKYLGTDSNPHNPAATKTSTLPDQALVHFGLHLVCRTAAIGILMLD